jgi:hypothetical protein
MPENQIPKIIATTVIGVRSNGKAAMGSDGQVTIGNTIMKHTTKKSVNSTTIRCGSDLPGHRPTHGAFR